MDTYTILVYALAYIGLFATAYYFLNFVASSEKKKEAIPATDKKVTIIIPAYNEEEGIVQTIESALALDYPKKHLEIIVIDDGSKDRTFELAKKFASEKNPVIKVFRKPNGGKGSALNKGIQEAKGEIIVSMDADTIVEPQSLKVLVGSFSNANVAAATPSMGVYKPKTIWQRIQQIEYYMGVFLRKSFSTMNAIHITPGAFSAYRKSFVEKYGGYDEKNITEDLEIALRIQSKSLIIENSPEAAVYTHGPATFRGLLIQRRRWYTGLMTNLWNYRKLFGKKTGSLGTVVLPTAVTTVTLGIIVTIYSVIRALLEIKKELLTLNAINFQFFNRLELNSYLFEIFFLRLFTNKVFLISLLFVTLMILYMKYARRKMLFEDSIRINLTIFLASFGFLFAFWWIVSTIHLGLHKKIIWRDEAHG